MPVNPPALTTSADGRMADPATFAAIDGFIETALIGPDPVIDAALAANAAAGLPAIDVSRAQGMMLELLVAATGAKRVLEVGTLGGVSTIHLARGAGEGGHVTTLELLAHHAAVARANVASAGLAGRVTVVEGPALDSLRALVGQRFDFAFIDADKANYPAYAAACADLVRSGGLIVADNAVRRLAVPDDAQDEQARGTRLLYDAVAADPRLRATAVQTVGAKGWDGFMLMLRV